MDWDSPIPVQEMREDEGIVVPETIFPLSEMEFESLHRLINPLADSEFWGVDIYTHVLSYFEECLQTRTANQ